MMCADFEMVHNQKLYDINWDRTSIQLVLERIWARFAVYPAGDRALGENLVGNILYFSSRYRPRMIKFQVRGLACELRMIISGSSCVSLDLASFLDKNKSRREEYFFCTRPAIAHLSKVGLTYTMSVCNQPSDAIRVSYRTDFMILMSVAFVTNRVQMIHLIPFKRLQIKN